MAPSRGLCTLAPNLIVSFSTAVAAAYLLPFMRIVICCSTGKLEVVPTKLMGTKEDLSVAYSPGECVLSNMLSVTGVNAVLTITSI
jgi:malic enzyme